MPIAISLARLRLANYKIGKKYGVRLRFATAHAIAKRMNELRETGVEFHSAMVQAATEQEGIGPERAALYRSAIALYGLWMRRAQEKGKIKRTRVRPRRRATASIARTCNAKGQYGFLK